MLKMRRKPWKAEVSDLRPEILDYVKSMQLSSHTIFLYETIDEKNIVLFTYVQDRVRKREPVSHYVHEGSVEEVE